MWDFPGFLVGIAALAALALVLLAHDWRDDLRERDARREDAHRHPLRHPLLHPLRHPLRDWWLRHRH